MPKINTADLLFPMENVNELEKEKIIHELMSQYSKHVYLLAYSYVKDQGLAEDISQEVFIKCYKHLEQFRGEANIKSWIYRITVNTAKDLLKSKAFQVLKYPKLFFESFHQSASSEELYLEQDRNEWLLQKVLKLPTKYREVIVLHYFEEFKTDEIAEILRINHNTVKTRLMRARGALKETLGPDKGDDLLGKGS